jgi:DHA2 family multidrug resistance protein-like MFS transporter
VSGVIVGALFVGRQQTLAHPLIDLRLFKVRAFSAALGAYTLATFVAFGIFLFISQYLQLVRGLTPFQSGLCMLPSFAAFIGGSMAAPIVARRVRPTVLMSAGFAVSAIGFLVLTQVDATSSVATIVTGCLVYSLGLAPVFTLTTDMIVGAAPPERAGAAAALSETGSELGGALGIAVLGSVGTAVYRHAMTGRAAGVPFAASRLVAGSKEAFSHSLAMVACVSVVVVLATAVAVVLTLDSNPSRRRAVT